MNDDETKRLIATLIATLIQVGDRANARITALEQRLAALDTQDERLNVIIGSLAVRITTIEQQLAILAQGENDDGR